MKTQERETLDRLFHPRGVAFFGGIGRPGSFGHLVLLSQLRYGYKGGLYPITQKEDRIAGLRTYRSLKEVDGPVDLAAVSVPAEAVPGILETCIEHGVAGVQIHSSGFAELGEVQAIALESRIAEIAARGLRIVGPNCFGIHCPQGGITLLPGFDFSRVPGHVAMISQSGGVATDFGYEAERFGLGVSKIVSFGNGVDLDAASLLDYLAHDPDTHLIAAYLEGVGNGKRFFHVLARTASTKPVVIWKGGLTPPGSRAAFSHTGSLGGGREIWEGLLRQAGAASVQGLDEMMDTLAALHYLERPVRRIALLGGGGAIGVFSSDLAHRWGLELPMFTQETQNRLKKHFPTPGNSMKNPLDTGTPVLPLETVQALAQEILTREPVDALIMIMLVRPLEVEMPAFFQMGGLEPPPRGSYLRGLVRTLADLKTQTRKEVVMVLDNRAHKVGEVQVEQTARQARVDFQTHGIPVYPNIERALKGIWHSSQTAAMGAYSASVSSGKSLRPTE